MIDVLNKKYFWKTVLRHAMTPTSPTVATWELGLRLREIREHKDLNPGSVAKSLGITQTYLSNIEHGRRTIAEEKLFALIELCGADEQRDELLALRRNSDRRGWWSRYNSSLPVELVKLFSYQHGATAIRSYEGALVSGLLQTEDYARAVHRGDVGNMRASDVETRVEARLRNQERLLSSEPLPTTIVMSEAALWQQVGGTAVLAGQLERLLSLIDHLPDLDLRILPFSAGGCGAMNSATFHVLEFATQRVRRLAWHETVTTLQLLDDEARIYRYDTCFAEALDCAADPDTSKKLITNALEHIT